MFSIIVFCISVKCMLKLFWNVICTSRNSWDPENKRKAGQAVVSHIFDSRTQEAEAGVQGHPGLQRKFQDSQNCVITPCVKTKKMNEIKDAD